ncbi:hypothetical protein B0H10DRAFT_1969671 [Mycena sp. CBHHK59/15]|nr:hypothetical protein B0H10DRAFT_1969671 [Mycena sp. CBHHK59/15]
MVRRSNIKANSSNVDYPVVSKDRDLIIPASRDPVTGGVEEALDLRAMRKTPGFQAVEEVLEDKIVLVQLVSAFYKNIVPGDQKHRCAHVESDFDGLGGRVLEVSNGVVGVRVRNQNFPRRGLMRINTTITSVMEVECLVHRGSAGKGAGTGEGEAGGEGAGAGEGEGEGDGAVGILMAMCNMWSNWSTGSENG